MACILFETTELFETTKLAIPSPILNNLSESLLFVVMQNKFFTSSV